MSLKEDAVVLQIVVESFEYLFVEYDTMDVHAIDIMVFERWITALSLLLIDLHPSQLLGNEMSFPFSGLSSVDIFRFFRPPPDFFFRFSFVFSRLV